MPAGDLVLYAKWSTASYQVSFNLNGAPEQDGYGAQTIAAGSAATEPAVPTRDGYTFAGWTLNGAPFNFGTPVTQAITLTAYWIKTGSFTVTYQNGGATVYTDPSHYAADSEVMVYNLSGVDGVTLTAPAGKVFIGWAYGGTTYYSGQSFTMIAADGTLVLKLYYTRNSYSITYQITGTLFANAEFAKGSFKYGASTSTLVPGSTDKVGYTFNTWSAEQPVTMLDDLHDRDSALKLRRMVQNRLSGREAEIIRLRYGLGGTVPLTQREIAASFGISRSYVSRIEKRALGKLRTAMEAPEGGAAPE